MRNSDCYPQTDISVLSAQQRRLVECLSTKSSLSVDALATRLRSTNKSVINQVRAIRKKLGAHAIETTSEGYRLGK